MVIQKKFFEKVDFEKNQQTTKEYEKLIRGQTVKDVIKIHGKLTQFSLIVYSIPLSQSIISLPVSL